MIHKSKLMLPILAAIVGVAASAFTTIKSSSKANNLSNTWYQYDGPTPQSPMSRENDSNYLKISEAPSCSGSSNECAVELNQDFGNVPDFTNVTFDPSTGVPIGGSSFVSNQEKH